jgi:hypothetical protein
MRRFASAKVSSSSSSVACCEGPDEADSNEDVRFWETDGSGPGTVAKSSTVIEINSTYFNFKFSRDHQ